jgi:hypothetical protein
LNLLVINIAVVNVVVGLVEVVVVNVVEGVVVFVVVLVVVTVDVTVVIIVDIIVLVVVIVVVVVDATVVVVVVDVTVAFVHITPAAFKVLQLALEFLGQNSKADSFPRHLMPLIAKGASTGPKKELLVKDSARKYPSCWQTTLA